MNTDPRIIVIHHSADFDGLFCREIARRHFGEQAEYIGWDYGQPEPVVPAETAIYLLDISVPGLMDHPRLTWIDHHQSAMEKYGVKPGLQIDGVAACRLAWQWFNSLWPMADKWVGGLPKGSPLIQMLDGEWQREDGKSVLPDKQDFVERRVREPFAVRLAGEYDIWDRRDPNAELFQHGLRAQELTPERWSKLLEYNLPDVNVAILLERGHVVRYAKEQENAEVITSYGFDVQWEGLCFLACNHPKFNSHLFTAGLRPRHEALLGFKWDGKLGRWRISLYHAPGHEHHDLSRIAVKYGWGGHRGACGFELQQLPFLP